MKRTEKNFKDDGKVSTKMAISIYLSIITLNVNRLNPLIRKHRVANWIKKKNQNSSICTSERRETESQGMEKDSNVNGNNKKEG